MMGLWRVNTDKVLVRNLKKGDAWNTQDRCGNIKMNLKEIRWKSVERFIWLRITTSCKI
jgi:hypothetical protein